MWNFIVLHVEGNFIEKPPKENFIQKSNINLCPKWDVGPPTGRGPFLPACPSQLTRKSCDDSESKPLLPDQILGARLRACFTSPAFHTSQESAMPQTRLRRHHARGVAGALESCRLPRMPRAGRHPAVGCPGPTQ